jgi:hypothetical protein
MHEERYTASDARYREAKTDHFGSKPDLCHRAPLSGRALRQRALKPLQREAKHVATALYVFRSTIERFSNQIDCTARVDEEA